MIKVRLLLDRPLSPSWTVPIPRSSKTSIITHERTRVGLSSYETKKLLSEIDSTIAKSKDQENQINIEKLKYYESDEFEKLIEPEYNYESCVEPR